MYPPISDVREIILQNLENRKKKEKLNIEILWEHDMKIHFSSWRGKTKSNFSSRISRDWDSCQGLVYAAFSHWTLAAISFFPPFGTQAARYSRRSLFPFPKKCINPENKETGYFKEAIDFPKTKGELGGNCFPRLPV